MKAQIIFIATALFLAVSGIQAQTNIQLVDIEVTEASIANRAMVAQFMEDLVSEDFAKARKSLHSDYFAYGVEGPDSLDSQQFIKVWKDYHKDASKLGMPMGICRAYKATFEGEPQEVVDLSGLTTWTPNATQKPIYSWAHMTFLVKEDKIYRLYHYQDNLPIMMQMGFSLQAPEWVKNGK